MPESGRERGRGGERRAWCLSSLCAGGAPGKCLVASSLTRSAGLACLRSQLEARFATGGPHNARVVVVPEDKVDEGMLGVDCKYALGCLRHKVLPVVGNPHSLLVLIRQMGTFVSRTDFCNEADGGKARSPQTSGRGWGRMDRWDQVAAAQSAKLRPPKYPLGAVPTDCREFRLTVRMRTLRIPTQIEATLAEESYRPGLSGENMNQQEKP